MCVKVSLHIVSKRRGRSIRSLLQSRINLSIVSKYFVCFSDSGSAFLVFVVVEKMNSSSNISLSFMRTTNDRDGSRKENAGCTNHSISARRKTTFFNPQTASLASISGRRQTMFIDTPNLPTKKSKNSISINTSGNLKKAGPSLAKQKNIVVKTTGSRLPTPLLPIKTAAERSHISNTKGKITNDSMALKSKDYLKNIPNRGDWQPSSNQSSFSHQERRSSLYGAITPLKRSKSSSHRRDSSPHRRDSSPHRRDSSSHRRDSSSHRRDSSSHRSDSSSHRRDSSSKRHSTSSESSANRLVVVQTHKSTKKRLSKERDHPNFNEKKICLTEIMSEKSVLSTAPGMSLKVDRKTSATLNNSSNLGVNSEDYKTRKQSKSVSTKETPADKIKCFIRPKDSKRIGSTTTAIENQDPQHKDDIWNPTLTLRRLNVDSLKRHGKSSREIVVSDDCYTVHSVDGKFIIKSKENHRLNSEGQQNWQSAGKANDEIFVTHIETRSISQQTEKRAFTRDVGVQKFDKEAEKQARQNKNSINLFTESVKEYETAVLEQQQSIDGLHQIVSERENTIAERERMIAERDLKIMEREQMIAERDFKIADRDLKIKEYEEKLKLQENNFHVMALQIDSLKQSKENLSKLFKEQEAKLKDLTKDDPAPAAETSRTISKILPIRVRNIEEMRNVSSTTAPANSQHSHTLSVNAVNPTNAIRNSTSPAESFAGFPNGLGWNIDTTLHSPTQFSTQASGPQSMEYLQMVIPSTSYMYMHNAQHTIQPTTSAGNSSDAQPTTSAANTYDAQPTTSAANTYGTQPTMPKTPKPANATPHQNLPRIIQRSVQDRSVLPRPSNQVNSAAQNGSHDHVSGFTQGGSNQQPRVISQIRGRAKTVYYGSPALQQPFQPHQALLPHQVLQQSHHTVQQAPSQSSNVYHCRR
ncbi:uncharacterized protein LOC119080674 [Bradysia coprophila]|uniref:uncharacterized protein LOC119080674 n=1 Tax=Bradysia coprophila TaxID=38358 RepID=UPI00187D877D|nr:uncharacterized protein LOC119080674 [Bradysia coprophila]